MIIEEMDVVRLVTLPCSGSMRELLASWLEKSVSSSIVILYLEIITIYYQVWLGRY